MFIRVGKYLFNTDQIVRIAIDDAGTSCVEFNNGEMYNSISVEDTKLMLGQLEVTNDAYLQILKTVTERLAEGFSRSSTPIQIGNRIYRVNVEGWTDADEQAKLPGYSNRAAVNRMLDSGGKAENQRPRPSGLV